MLTSSRALFFAGLAMLALSRTVHATGPAEPEPRVDPPTEPAAPAPVAPEPAPAEPEPTPTEPEGGFFEPQATEPAAETTVPAPKPSTSTAPPMPEIEVLPAKPGTPEPGSRGLFDLSPPDANRSPAGSEGGSFFDPGKLSDTGPSGGSIQIRGFIAVDFAVTMRTNSAARESDGTFRRLDPIAYFDVPSAALYVGAPVFADVVYARIGIEFVSIPQQQLSGGNFDIIAQSRRSLFVESAALEVNPFAWAKRAPDWVSQGFKVTGGVFIVPFGLEDEEHAAPANWFVSRPRSMTSNRVYPGTWTDVGAFLKWKPTFRPERPIRPIEIDVGFVNGDACTQTRFIDQLVLPSGFSPATCERRLRPGEVDDEAMADIAGTSKIDAGFFGIAPDNNKNKSVLGRLQVFPLTSINVGGSFVWGKHPEAGEIPASGESAVELRQAPSWRAGAHLELNFEEMFETRYPLPHLRGEFVYGEDRAVGRAMSQFTHRRMLGGYGQIAQQLFRRKKTRLPGLILQYRFDHADPDLAVPGVVNGVDLVSDFGDNLHPRESTLQSHTIGLRFPVLPRFTLKAEYSIIREDGGRRNQLYNDLFAFEMVADF